MLLGKWLETLASKINEGQAKPVLIGLDRWTAQAAQASRAAEIALAANQAPVAERRELRGRLQALKAKAQALGLRRAIPETERPGRARRRSSCTTNRRCSERRAIWCGNSKGPSMSGDKCQRRGCTGIIEDGYCNACGLADPVMRSNAQRWWRNGHRDWDRHLHSASSARASEPTPPHHPVAAMSGTRSTGIKAPAPDPRRREPHRTAPLQLQRLAQLPHPTRRGIDYVARSPFDRTRKADPARSESPREQALLFEVRQRPHSRARLLRQVRHQVFVHSFPETEGCRRRPVRSQRRHGLRRPGLDLSRLRHRPQALRRFKRFVERRGRSQRGGCGRRAPIPGFWSSIQTSSGFTTSCATAPKATS